MAKNEKKRPFEIRLANAIADYENKFGVHPPIFGYEDDELYQILLDSLKNNTEMIGSADNAKDFLDLKDDDILIT